MPSRSEWCLALQGARVHELRAWIHTLQKVSAMELAFMEYKDKGGVDRPPPPATKTREMVKCLKDILQSEEKLDSKEENAVQFYSESTSCPTVWATVIDIITDKAEYMDVAFAYARIGANLDDEIDRFAFGKICSHMKDDRIVIHRSLETPFLPAEKRG